MSAGDEHWGFSRPFANPGDQHDDRFDIARLHRCLSKQRVRGHDHGIPTAFAERNDRPLEFPPVMIEFRETGLGHGAGYMEGASAINCCYPTLISF